MNLELVGHVAVIVGGASGIGLATANAFAGEGAGIAIWDRDENVTDVARQIETENSVSTVGLQVDVCDGDAVRSAMAKTVQTLGCVSHLVHAAAIGSGKFGFPFTNLSPGDWSRVLEVNVMGMTNVAHAVAPHMVERRSGTMVFVASVAGQIGSQTDPPYSASKAANINFSQCIAKDLAAQNVRVNTVCPGMVETPLGRSVWQAWHDQTPLEQRLSFEQWSQRKLQSVVPQGTWQTAEDVADMILFLSSARAQCVTGQTVNVDGGTVMHS